ncbi:MAG TPA: hypothetical protein PKM44_07815 [Turneriella sp.]|nr:hypothetical protein [Turneriella sp.]HMY11442.1 hypothetical protein [Turneriella sp.]HNE20343.1 hypothetical protein [Turneriella sp.]HNJ66430.1 hypothetical protein [Turneriella sp.]HNL10403.1 hypothetical protein [Turneriella sp.]
MIRLVSFALVLVLLQACVGSRHTVKFQELEYPVSMSGQLYGSDKRMKADGAGLDIIGDVEVTRRYWSLLYSFAPLGDTTQQVRDLNRVIAARGAQGVVHFEIENEGCDMNNFALLVAPAVLPFFPGCSKITLRGKLVRESR